MNTRILRQEILQLSSSLAHYFIAGLNTIHKRHNILHENSLNQNRYKRELKTDRYLATTQQPNESRTNQTETLAKYNRMLNFYLNKSQQQFSPVYRLFLDERHS